MGVKGFLLLMFMITSAYCLTFKNVFGQSPEALWSEMEREIEQDEVARLVPQKRPGSLPEARKVPKFVPIAASSDQMSLVGPGNDAKSLPDSLKDILLATRGPPTERPPYNNPIDILCHINRIYVRVQRELLARPDAYSYLKFGSCPVNQATDSHFYLLYSLMACGTVITVGDLN